MSPPGPLAAPPHKEPATQAGLGVRRAAMLGRMRPLRLRLLAACLASGLLPLAAWAQPALEACRLPGLEREARCGTVKVPADPAAPAGKTISVKFAVLPAVARQKLPDPVFVFAGGPGQSASGVAGQAAAVLGQLNQRRDLVFVDQRGTGGSAPFECREDSEKLGGFDPARAARRLADCARSASIDPALLATWIAVRDIDAVRERLGAARINLWGGSYGTRVELEYLRQFPERVRSAVLDGVAPPDMRLPVSIALDAEAALAALVAACATDARCHARHPALAADIERLLARAGRGERVKIRDPLTGQVESVPLSRELLAALLRLPLYAPSLAATLPDAIAAAIDGRYEPLAAAASGLAGAVAENFAEGMHYAVVCNEDQPRITAADRAQAAATRFGNAILKTYDAACAALPTRPVPAEFYEVGARPVPVLLLSGGRDPVTPPRHAEAVARQLGNARHLIAPNLGHGVSAQGCAPELVARFIRQASFDGISGDCLAAIPAPIFFQPPERR